MKITIEHQNLKAVVEDADVIDICEAIELMERALEEAGYSALRIQGAIHHRGQEIGKNLGLD